MPVSEKEFLELALKDPSEQWELYCGEPRQKPPMTAEHNHVTTRIFGRLFQQLDERAFTVRSNLGHVRRSAENYFIPDVFVVPMDLVRPLRGQRNVLEAYPVPLPLIVEVWSPSTGAYDVDTKLPEYQRRGDLEIWRIHPYDRILTAWRRQPDGSYGETIYHEGTIRPVALPGVTIDLDTLFD
jgi:Uma2 family endonuclease